MLETTLIIRWLISLVIIILLLAAFFIALRFLKEKGYAQTMEKDDNKMKLLDQFYLDSKNKVVKIKDGDKVLTILVGASASLIKEEKVIKEDV
jgi:flagellar biogenesis protein FliO